MLPILDASSPVLQAMYRRIDNDPDGACLSDDSTRLSNAEFGLEVDAVAAELVDAGVAAGDVVAVLLPNRIDIITTMFAAWVLGATLTPRQSRTHRRRGALSTRGLDRPSARR